MTQQVGFTSDGRRLQDEDRIVLTSVGIDIGSSTSHVVFSRLEMERQDNRYVVVERTVLGESPIALTPYRDAGSIDAEALGKHIDASYQQVGLQPDQVDTGALILTGMALERENARAIGDLFSAHAGRFVTVSAGDNLEATLAAHGSGAAQLSVDHDLPVLNVDIGGGTTKFALCQAGEVRQVAAVDIGARLIATDGAGRVVRLEESGARIAKGLGLAVAIGSSLANEDICRISEWMADRVVEFVTCSELPAETAALLRTPALRYTGPLAGVVFSGGVSEFISGHETAEFGDLGRCLGHALRKRLPRLGAPVQDAQAGIRATVVGASQYSVQLSGSTIFLAPVTAVPVRNLPVVSPALPLDGPEVDAAAVSRAVLDALTKSDLAHLESPVALTVRWAGHATFARLSGLCTGVVNALQPMLDRGQPLVIVCDGDIGGLLGLHLREELHLAAPIISIDGVQVRDLDYIDIGAMIPASGAVPVIIKSLVFPH